jgi:hypothetical protein
MLVSHGFDYLNLMSGQLQASFMLCSYEFDDEFDVRSVSPVFFHLLSPPIEG